MSMGGDAWVPKPPDGGWGWVIMMACFGVQFVWGGLFNSYGVLYKEFLVYFGQSRGYTSLIGSVLNGLGYGAGLLASGLMNRYGIRAVALVGAAVGGVACALCMFANSVAALIFLFGGGVGLGHALSYTAAYVIVPYYFEKRRGMASGVALAGSGVGNIVCAPLMRYLLAEYTWRGFMVIQAGLILQCCVFAALFRPVPTVPLHTTTDEPIKENRVDSDMEEEEDDAELESNMTNKFKRFRERMYSDVTNHSRRARSTVLPPIPESIRTMDGRRRTRLYSQQFTELGPIGGHPVGRKVSRPYLRKDIYFANSLRQLPEYRSKPDLYWQSALTTSTDEQPADTKQAAPKSTSKLGSIWNALNDTLGLDLLRRPEFLFFALAIFALYFSYYVPYTVLYEFATERGVPEGRAVTLLSILGVANTAGRVLLGSVADFRCINRLAFFVMVTLMMGLSCCFCVFYTHYYAMAAFAALFAACVGASKALTLIVTVDLMGLENLTKAYGLLLLFQGLGFILGNPFAGWIRDVTGNYVLAFSIIGGVLIVSGLLTILAARMKPTNKTQAV